MSASNPAGAVSGNHGDYPSPPNMDYQIGSEVVTATEIERLHDGIARDAAMSAITDIGNKMPGKALRQPEGIYAIRVTVEVWRKA